MSSMDGAYKFWRLLSILRIGGKPECNNDDEERFKRGWLPREPEGSVSNFYERRFKHWESARRRYRIVDFRDWLISRSTIKHVQFYRMVPSNLRSYNRQNLYAPSIDDILAFATYINVHDIDIFLRRNWNAHYKHIRKSALALYSSDIELVVRKEDSTSNRRLSSLNFKLLFSPLPLHFLYRFSHESCTKYPHFGTKQHCSKF